MTLSSAKIILMALAEESDRFIENNGDTADPRTTNNYSQISSAIKLVLLELEYAEKRLRHARSY